jgi:hypothetical protein
MVGTCIDNLVDKQRRITLFETSLIQIMKINTNMNGLLLICNKDRVKDS